MKFCSFLHVIDLKFVRLVPHNSTNEWKENGVEYRPNRLFSNHGSPLPARFSAIRRTISGEFQSQNVFLQGSIPLHGVRSTLVPRKSARYRILSSVGAKQTLPHGLAKRSDYQTQRILPLTRRSRYTSPNTLLRRREGEVSHLSDQPVDLSGYYDIRILLASLAGRTLKKDSIL